ncbi:MAG: hypothetical protein KIH08_13310 [Candidatus Freyarchaeota archaeon]|nr:hypothetical protein [Candidatus Jordarchaeia archaeon]MBS7270247.1 hypothetical protein [Candidatus Jordarchaeia archaeon]MBS7280588.1 hypothetical protein [Candidatus Jordarchaeia archaeon]
MIGNLPYVCVFFAQDGTERYFIVPAKEALEILLRRAEKYYAGGRKQNKDRSAPYRVSIVDILEYENGWDLV